MRTVKLILEYDGTEFVGWQFQNNGRSVQGVMEAALQEILQEEIRVTGAGRTDSGVHAKAQVAHFHTASTMEPRQLYRALNGVLPDDLVVRWVEDMKSDFHARYSAIARTYRYCISQVPIALSRRYQWFVGHPLNLEAMQFCADQIKGDHDFRAFCKSEAKVDQYRCQVSNALWTKDSTQVSFVITANRFLHGMVRALVGTMVEIGRGHREKDQFSAIMSSGDRTQAGMSAPAHGLILEEVVYQGQ